ncbi:MAG: phosphodiester glycosidase family protein [Acidimicrobiales bacterium]
MTALRPPPPRHLGRPPARRRRRRLAYLLVAPVVLVALVATSLVGAVATPGNESFSAKWADWLRSHHAGALVNPVENLYYERQAPAKGGRPKALNPLPGAGGGGPGPATPSVGAGAGPAGGGAGAGSAGPAGGIQGGGPADGMASPAPAGLAPPAPVPLVVSPALAGEGRWQPIGPAVGGSAAMYVAQFRADSVYTSQITSAVWIDPTRLHVSLVPGASEPGGSWTQPPYITTEQLPKAVAAFNGGFRSQDARGGFYLDGRAQVPLRDGAASMVIYSDGHVDVGTWGNEVTMTPQVTAVLQNLVSIVDGGQPAPSATYGDSSTWGATLGAAVVVARSGVGVTADGGLVYVGGPALSAFSLAESLQRAGAVRAMTLDINPEWVTFNLFGHPDPTQPAQVVATKLYPQMQRPATRYLGPAEESRDFFVVSAP